ncbi:hypothetical protein PLCT2_01702 [Planctomycetaceae bacterium]|nr:hypothetical protein PLCT2_01702 [Planctomycetaceae bacterium]
MGAPAIPALLLPLFDETRVVEGGDEALRVSIALREALASEGNCTVLQARPDLCIVQIATVEGVFSVRAHEAGFMARISPRRFGVSAREWRALWHCIDHNVACARPVALLAARDSRADYLVSERSGLFAPLRQWLEREHDRLMSEPALARSLASGMAACVASMHQAGVLPPDLSADHFAVRAPRPGASRFEFLLLEAGAEALPGRVDDFARKANLGVLSLEFSKWPATLKLRFVRDYRALLGDSKPEQEYIQSIVDGARQRQFDRNTLSVAHCAEPTARQAVVEREGVTLLLNRAHAASGLADLEESLARTPAAQWAELLTRHFEANAGENGVCRMVHALNGGDEKQMRRRIEAMWGRLCELEAIGARAPLPLACVAARESLVILGQVGGRLESLAAHRHDRDWVLTDQLARELVRYHAFGLYFLPAEPALTLGALSVCVTPRGGREFVLTGPEQLFRGKPSQLGAQAVASLGRVARAIGNGLGERALKELVWAYARSMFLKSADAQLLLDEALRVPTGRTLVMTRGFDRNQLASEARP